MSNTAIFLLNIEGQSNIKAFKDTGMYYVDLNSVVDKSVELLLNHLSELPSLQKCPKAISTGNVVIFSNECEEQVRDVVKNGTQDHRFTITVQDTLNNEHAITFHLRRVHVES